MKRDVIIKYNIFTNIERKKKPTEIIYCDKKKYENQSTDDNNWN